MTGLYIHIPFCKSKCPYCDFYSFKPTAEQMDIYLSSVLKSIDKYKNEVHDKIDSIYFGGGTPSLFEGKRISKIIEKANESFTLENPEITVECNPSSSDKLLFSDLKRSGVNRISFGLQSAVESERKALGRISSKAQTEKAIFFAREKGIENISLDLMLGIPYQKKESLIESIEFIAESKVQHVSAYMLKIEEGTPFFKKQDSLLLPDEDEVCDIYLKAYDELQKKGFMQYEISNFSLPGFESRHNLHYWNTEEYLGIGPSAHSFLNGKRFYFERNFDDFISLKDPTPDGRGGSEEEFIMLALRLTKGLIGEKFKERFGHYPEERIYENAEKISSSGFVKINGKNIQITREGFLISNAIIGKILS